MRMPEWESLVGLAQPLSSVMGWGKRLYCSEQDIRAFLGGIAMNKLHILQGISGTGKTSFPIAFARALGRRGRENYKLVEVQAAWRDRQDLIGYYNSFEGKFYETEFLAALYEARCPKFRDQIYIIILDEMNLSRPEQYFANFLSKLEQDAPELILNTDLERPSPNFSKRMTHLSFHQTSGSLELQTRMKLLYNLPIKLTSALM